MEGGRAPRRSDAERDRGERPARFSRDEGTRRPSFGAARGADDTRRPSAPRIGRPSDSGPRGERPARRERDDSRERSTSERPRFGAERAASDGRRPSDRPARDDTTRRAPTGSRDERPGPRGSFERRERTFAKPVKSGYGERPERAPREDRAARPAIRREFGDQPPRGERPAAGTRAPRGTDSAAGSRFAERDRAGKPPRSTSSAARPTRSEEAAPRASAPRRDHDDAPGTLRLSKLMSELGLCSRREADEWIENGWVRVDGEKIDTLGTKVRPDQRVEIDPAAQAIQARLVTILLHKPVGYVSGQAEDGYQPAVTLFTPDNRWEADNSDIRFSVSHLRHLAPAGRLDI
ncbi:MAG TPA: S4 domain-containing protein, partial [Paraburkholderia sp.]